MTTTFVGVREIDAAGRTRCVHAVASEDRGDGDVGTRTACGLPARPHPGARAAWNAVRGEDRCLRCADAVLTVRLRALRPSPRLPGMEWWQL